jgi:hypothetical protein
MENKYTAEDLAKALLNLEHKVTYEEYRNFVDAITEKWNVCIENNDAYDLLDYLGAEKFLDDYNEYFKKNKLTIEDLEIGDIITDGETILVVLSKMMYSNTVNCFGSDGGIYRISNATISLYTKATNITLNSTINSVKNSLKIVEEQVKKEN